MSNLSDAWRKAWAAVRGRWYLRGTTHLGGPVRVWGCPYIHNEGQIIVGDRVRLVSTVATLELVTGERGVMELGDRVYINYGSSFAASQLIRIGPDCNIGTYVIMMDNDFHRLEPERRREWPESAPIILEENVWLGARVIVLRGVTIGAHSVVGAGSVVTRDIPPRSLAVGNPARVIRNL